MNGPADSGECGLVLARHGSRLNLRASAAQHGAYGVVAEPPLHSGRELPQLGADRLVRGHAAPQRHLGLLIRRRCQRGHGGLRPLAELRDGRGIGLALRFHTRAIGLRGPGFRCTDAFQAFRCTCPTLRWYRGLPPLADASQSIRPPISSFTTICA
jgi:hypothetical protein